MAIRISVIKGEVIRPDDPYQRTICMVQCDSQSEEPMRQVYPQASVCPRGCNSPLARPALVADSAGPLNGVENENRTVNHTLRAAYRAMPAFWEKRPALCRRTRSPYTKRPAQPLAVSAGREEGGGGREGKDGDGTVRVL